MIRDLINIYHKREMLNVPCPSCQNFGHSIIKCPLVNYVPNKALILDHFKRDNFQRRRRKPPRKQRKKIDSRMMKQKIKLASDILTMRYPELSENKCEESSFYSPTDPKSPQRISIFGTCHNIDNFLLNEEEKVDTLEKVENDFKNQEVQGQMFQSQQIVNKFGNFESAQSCIEMKKSSIMMNENNFTHKFDKNRLKMLDISFDSPKRKSIME